MIRLSRDEILEENIRVFGKLTPSQKLRYVQKVRRQQAYFRKLVWRKEKACESREAKSSTQ